ncbi:chorismate--pyruvate lyase family protein [Thermithiobacillus plumbiphilus]|uniref:Probable chorismate pyruvate-lyase n=1 Tax=Thermithiobacillus plumbiphilus TaxID=1729899 RepID=A0ABU9D8L4_9PROT
MRGWLGVSGSFTEALRRHCQGAIRAQILRQAHVRPRPDEARLLRLGPGEQALLRESLLYCSHCPTPWIHARTLIPLRHLRGTLKPLARWGSRPIGDLLFRSPCQARRLRLDILRLAGTPATAGRLWARRSLYQSCDQRLLVQEILLPALLPFRE